MADINNPIILPQLKRFKSNKSLILNKRSEIYDYELIITDKESNKFIRYVSDNESIAIGEYVASYFINNNELIKDSDIKNSFIYIEEVNEQYSYIVYIQNGEVEKELCNINSELLSVFEYFSRKAPIITHDENVIHKIGFNKDQIDLEILNEKIDIFNVPEQYYLIDLYETEYKKERVKRAVVFVCALLMMVAGSIGAYKYLNPPPPPPAPPPPNPVIVWKESLLNKTPLSAGLNEVTKSLSYFYLLPQDWVITSTSVRDKAVIITIGKKNSESRLGTLEQWINAYPEVSAWFNKDTLTFNFPINEVIPEKWYRLGSYPKDLYDLLISFGASRLAMNDLLSIGKVKRTQYSFMLENITYASLLSLSEILANKPISIDEINIKQLNDVTMITANITFTLEGV